MSPVEVEANADALLALLDEALSDSPLSVQRHGDLAYLDGRLRGATDHDRQHLVVAETAEGRTVGIVMGIVGTNRSQLPGELEARHPGFAANALFVLWIAVAPSHRRTGLATSLLPSLLSAAGTGHAWLFVDERNEPALRMYRQLDWLEIGRVRSRRVFGTPDTPRLGT